MMDETLAVHLAICRFIVEKNDSPLRWLKQWRFDECEFLINNGHIEYELEEGNPRYGLFNLTEDGQQYYTALKQLGEL